MMLASRHCAKVELARVRGSTWKSPAIMTGREREQAAAPTVASAARFVDQGAASKGEVDGVVGVGRRGSEVDRYGDGAAWYGGADVDGARGSVANKDADSAAGASANAWDGAFDMRAPVIAHRPGAEVGDAVGEDVQRLRGDDRGVSVAKES